MKILRRGRGTQSEACRSGRFLNILAAEQVGASFHQPIRTTFQASNFMNLVRASMIIVNIHTCRRVDTVPYSDVESRRALPYVAARV